MFFQSGQTQNYFSLTELKQYIIDKVGVDVPVPVLRNSIKALSKNQESDVVLDLYQKGDYFQIKHNWDQSINISFEEQSDSLSAQLRKTEILFQEYLELEQISSRKTFLNLFIDSAEDVINYVNQGNASSVVNEEYVNVIRFTEWLKNTENELYEIVNNLMWGSIVAGFLQRSNVEPDIRVVDEVDYYLDTSLVLSILKLDSAENIAYAKDLLKIILDSGSAAYAHPITIQELSHILCSVENSQGPKPGTSIEFAWDEQGWTLSKILHLRNNLADTLRNEYGINVPTVRTLRLSLPVETHIMRICCVRFMMFI